MSPSISHEKTGRAVWDDINRAAFCHEAFIVLTTKPIKFLQVYKTVGILLPNVLFCDLVITLARLFDTDSRPTAASVNSLLRRAKGALPKADFDRLAASAANAKGYLRIARNKHLAHRDVSSDHVNLKIAKLAQTLELAKEIHRATMRALTPGHHWAYGFPSAEGDAKKLVEVLAEWNYTPIRERRVKSL